MKSGVVSEALDEISIETGGFKAEYEAKNGNVTASKLAKEEDRKKDGDKSKVLYLVLHRTIF